MRELLDIKMIVGDVLGFICNFVLFFVGYFFLCFSLVIVYV